MNKSDKYVLLRIIEDLDALTPDILPQADWIKQMREHGKPTKPTGKAATGITA